MSDRLERDTARRRPRKRGAGEGTVYQRKDGLWVAELMVGRKPDGKRDVRTVSGKTQAEARKRLEQLKRDVQQGLVVARPTHTVADVLDQWLDDCVTRGLRPKTVASYRQLVRSYLKPALGAMKLAALRPLHVRRLLADLTGRKLSVATVRYVYTILHAALKLALRMDLVGRNVADAVTPPKRARPQLHPPTPEQAAKLLDVALSSGDRLAALWTLGIYGGCRPGELLALQWEDVNWDAGSVTIRRSLSKVNRAAPTFTDPKTARGRRTITLPGEAIDALRVHRQRQLAERLRLGADYFDSGLVFASHTGSPLIPRNVVRAFKRLLGQAGLPTTIRWYDLRHSHATALLVAGVHPKVASERLGHSSVTLTLDTYSHVIPGMDADAAAKVQRAIRGDAETKSVNTANNGEDAS